MPVLAAREVASSNPAMAKSSCDCVTFNPMPATAVCSRPAAVESYDLEHLTGDLVGLLDHLKIEKAIFAGHDWGGFVVWQMPLRHPDRVAGVIGLNTPFTPRSSADPIAIMRAA